MNTVTYRERHIGPSDAETADMLKVVGVSSMDELIQRTVPGHNRLKQGLDVGTALTELEVLELMRDFGRGNQRFEAGERAYTLRHSRQVVAA